MGGQHPHHSLCGQLVVRIIGGCACLPDVSEAYRCFCHVYRKVLAGAMEPIVMPYGSIKSRSLGAWGFILKLLLQELAILMKDDGLGHAI